LLVGWLDMRTKVIIFISASLPLSILVCCYFGRLFTVIVCPDRTILRYKSCYRNRHHLQSKTKMNEKDMFCLWARYLPLDVTSVARFSCNKSATICFISISLDYSSYFLICSYIHATASSLLFFSQIPSHPMSMKSTPFSRVNSYVSGLAVIAYSSGFKCSRCLYFRSPRLRVRFRLPSTRPSVIVDPDLVILSISV